MPEQQVRNTGIALDARKPANAPPLTEIEQQKVTERLARMAVQMGVTAMANNQAGTAEGVARSVASTQRSALKDATYVAKNPSLASLEAADEVSENDESPEVGEEDDASDFSYIQVTVDPDNVMTGGDRLVQGKRHIFAGILMFDPDCVILP